MVVKVIKVSYVITVTDHIKLQETVLLGPGDETLQRTLPTAASDIPVVNWGTTFTKLTLMNEKYKVKCGSVKREGII
jgi:hypothetical protein